MIRITCKLDVTIRLPFNNKLKIMEAKIIKSWTNADLMELDINETAYGKNLHAKEANANKPHGKKDNNGAGGNSNPNPSDPIIPGEDPTEWTS